MRTHLDVENLSVSVWTRLRHNSSASRHDHTKNRAKSQRKNNGESNSPATAWRAPKPRLDHWHERFTKKKHPIGAGMDRPRIAQRKRVKRCLKPTEFQAWSSEHLRVTTDTTQERTLELRTQGAELVYTKNESWNPKESWNCKHKDAQVSQRNQCSHNGINIDLTRWCERGCHELAHHAAFVAIVI